MSIKLVTAPICEPVTFADMEGQCLDDLTAQTATVNSYIIAARQRAENDLHRALITSTYDLVMDCFPPATNRNPFAGIEIPLPPLQSVVSIKYLSADHVLTTLDPAAYTVNTDSEPGQVLPAYGGSWPETLDYPGSVRVQFVAGYGGPVAWNALTVYPVGARVLYTNGETYRKIATSIAGILPTVPETWTLDHPGYAVPQCIRNWILLNAATMLENRESLTVGQGGVIDLTTMADTLLDPERWGVRV